MKSKYAHFGPFLRIFMSFVFRHFPLGTPKCLGFSVGPPSVLVSVWDPQVSWFQCGTPKCLVFSGVSLLYWF